jgi:UDP-2,3-diacylglucosamine pyrophosphatase LpxH
VYIRECRCWEDGGVTTLVVSDLHLGGRSDGILLHRAEFVEKLAGAVEGAEQVVLLGDVIELRDRPVGEALERARPLFEALGEAVGDGQIVVIPGNHDHQLLAPWLESRRLRGARKLELEEKAKPGTGLLGSLARRMGRAEVVLAYPGMWIRPDLYATHGHYLDCHLTVPTFERLAVGTMERVLGGLPHGGRIPDDYESVQGPLYSLLYGIAQSGERIAGRVAGANASARTWHEIHGRDGRPRSRRGRLLGSIVVPGAVRLAARLGIGPLRTDLSLEEIGRAGVRAMREVVTRLDIEAEHVVFGHTHRRGPLGAEPGWSLPGEPAFHNTGSWVYAPALLRETARESVFWPGTMGVVADRGAPELRHLLEDAPHAELRSGT